MSIEKFSEIKEKENMLEKGPLEDSQLPEMQEWESLEEGIDESLESENVVEEDDGASDKSQESESVVEKDDGAPMAPMWDSFKICAERHGCTGATNCNSCMIGPEGH